MEQVVFLKPFPKKQVNISSFILLTAGKLYDFFLKKIHFNSNINLFDIKNFIAVSPI